MSIQTAKKKIEEENLKPIIEFNVNSTSCNSVDENGAGIWNEPRIVSSYRAYIVDNEILLMEKYGEDNWFCKQLLYGFTNESMIIRALSDKIKKLEEKISG